MSVTSGFFNAINHDRRYDARQMSTLFDGIITDGVFMNIGTAMVVKANPVGKELHNMSVYVGTGRAWFNSSWTHNDAILPLEIADSELALDRMDMVVLEVNNEDDVRENTIKIIKGEPGTNPVSAALVETERVHQHPLARVLVKAGVTEITAGDITNCVGTAECPFITGILETIDSATLLDQWDYQFNTWMNGNKMSFMNWFENLKVVLDGDVASHLQNEIETLFQAHVDNANTINNLRESTTAEMNEMKSNFQAGVNTIIGMVNTKTGAGPGNADYLPPNSSPTQVAAIINKIGVAGKTLFTAAGSDSCDGQSYVDSKSVTLLNMTVQQKCKLTYKLSTSGRLDRVTFRLIAGRYTFNHNAQGTVDLEPGDQLNIWFQSNADGHYVSYSLTAVGRQ